MTSSTSTTGVRHRVPAWVIIRATRHRVRSQQTDQQLLCDLPAILLLQEAVSPSLILSLVSIIMRFAVLSFLVVCYCVATCSGTEVLTASSGSYEIIASGSVCQYSLQSSAASSYTIWLSFTQLSGTVAIANSSNTVLLTVASYTTAVVPVFVNTATATIVVSGNARMTFAWNSLSYSSTSFRIFLALWWFHNTYGYIVVR